MVVLQQIARKKEIVWEPIVIKTQAKTIHLSMQFSAFVYI